ncbi:unnamed protein product [Mytilus coruscus]|uniref:Uncharacterized protein n=1 Tax=Mytilus coruscus TaxID=42192 RepID=A0A6J8EJH0_MYTCO|nr:unnamed protein product [Mytilus coruscus]
MDHQDVIKAFRSGATMESVIPRMSLIDSLNDVQRSITEKDNEHKEKEKSLPDILGITLNSTDMVYILRITGLILRRGGISTIPNKNVYNMYEPKPDNLPESILDQHSKEADESLSIYSKARLLKTQSTEITGIQKALLSILIQTYTNQEQQHLDEDNGKEKLESDGTVILGSKVIPPSLASSTTYATLEFAGIKFSSFAYTGNEYLNYIGKDVVGLNINFSKASCDL